MSQRWAVALGLLAFFMVSVSGLVRDADTDRVLLRAIVALAIFSGIGKAAGAVAERILAEGGKREESPSSETEPKV